MRKMKDSGIEWIGEIPEDWEIRSFKIHFQLEKGLSITKENLIETGYPVISYGQIHSKKNFGTKVNDSLIKFVSNEYLKTSQHCLANKNDFIFADTSEDTDGIGNFIFIDRARPIFAGYHTIIARPTNIYFPKYYAYLFYADCWRNQLRSYAAGIKVFSITKKLLYHTSIINPPEAQQVAIANFLDEKCALIDRLVERHQEVIEKLKAYRQSVISEAVTRGLAPNAPMKDSGIPWIGKIPEGWKTIKLKYLIKYIESGVSVNAGHNAAKENEYGVLKTSCVSKFNFDINENKSVDFSEMGRTRCPVLKNTIIVSRMNTPELVGACGYVEKNYPNIFLPDRLWQVHFKNNTNIKYIWYYLICKNIRNYYASLSTGTSSSMQNISQEQFEQVIIVLPDTTTQNKITSYLDSKCQFIDSTITKKQSLIAKLAEYKKSIIYEYVTGKKEVPAS